MTPADHGDITGIVAWRGIELLVRCFVFLVDDDESQVCERCKHGGSGADDNPGVAPVSPPPRVMPLARRHAAVHHRHVGPEVRFEPADHLGGERDLGHQDDRRLVPREAGTYRFDVDLRLPAPRHAVEEKCPPVSVFHRTGQCGEHTPLCVVQHDAERLQFGPEILLARHLNPFRGDDAGRDKLPELRQRCSRVAQEVAHLRACGRRAPRGKQVFQETADFLSARRERIERTPEHRFAQQIPPDHLHEFRFHRRPGDELLRFDEAGADEIVEQRVYLARASLLLDLSRGHFPLLPYERGRFRLFRGAALQIFQRRRRQRFQRAHDTLARRGESLRHRRLQDVSQRREVIAGDPAAKPQQFLRHDRRGINDVVERLESGDGGARGESGDQSCRVLPAEGDDGTGPDERGILEFGGDEVGELPVEADGERHVGVASHCIIWPKSGEAATEEQAGGGIRGRRGPAVSRRPRTFSARISSLRPASCWGLSC